MSLRHRLKRRQLQNVKVSWTFEVSRGSFLQLALSSTTDTVAAPTIGAKAMYFTTGAGAAHHVSAGAMYSPAGAGAGAVSPAGTGAVQSTADACAAYSPETGDMYSAIKAGAVSNTGVMWSTARLVLRAQPDTSGCTHRLGRCYVLTRRRHTVFIARHRAQLAPARHTRRQVLELRT